MTDDGCGSGGVFVSCGGDNDDDDDDDSGDGGGLAVDWW